MIYPTTIFLMIFCLFLSTIVEARGGGGSSSSSRGGNGLNTNTNTSPEVVANDTEDVYVPEVHLTWGQIIYRFLVV